jgi:hypothetical protein
LNDLIVALAIGSEATSLPAMEQTTTDAPLRERLIVREVAAPGRTIVCDVCLEAAPMTVDLCIAGGFTASICAACVTVAARQSSRLD